MLFSLLSLQIKPEIEEIKQNLRILAVPGGRKWPLSVHTTDHLHGGHEPWELSGLWDDCPDCWRRGNCLSEVAWRSHTLSTQLPRFPGERTGVFCALCPGVSSSQNYNIVKDLLLSDGEGLGK